MSAGAVLEVRRLSVSRGGRLILDDVSVSVAAGEIVAVVGPNGAGKTTLLEGVLGAVSASGGECLADGHELGGLAARARRLAYVSGEAEPPAEARVDVLVESAAGADPGWARLLETRLGLLDLRGARIGALSRGERRRILLFEALASGKPFLLLDEPTGVFDPLQLLDVVDLFRQTAARGAGLLLTVHQLSDAEALATRVLVLNKGRAIALGTVDEIRRQSGVPGGATLNEAFLALLEAREERSPGGPT